MLTVGAIVGAMALTLAIYVVGWQYGNRVGVRRERERIENLRASGWLKEKQDVETDRREDVGDDKEIRM